MTALTAFTPRETVGELDRYIVGQQNAKRAVAIALRNRWRRQQVSAEMRDEIAPKNIIMIGPTGVGKTEIARRLAKLGQAPFIKVEASKFTEVGYVGRDVESMIRDLVDVSMNMVREEESEKHRASAERATEERLLDLLVPKTDAARPSYFAVAPDGNTTPVLPANVSRSDARKQLRKGELDELLIAIEAAVAAPMLEVFNAPGMEEMMGSIKDALGGLQMGQRTQEKTVTVKDARRIFSTEESEKLVDMDRVKTLAIERVEQSGIVFLDEIDKIAGAGTRGGGGRGPDVSRGGVQRDLLPIVEGCTVNTKHGPTRTDHILFIAAGAFHETSVSELIPELQGRFPIRVELSALSEDDFFRILTEPKNNLIRQYVALLATEDVALSFDEEALRQIARTAYTANTQLENIGARRLHTVMENLLEEISFTAPESRGDQVLVDATMVHARLDQILEDEDLSRYIL